METFSIIFDEVVAPTRSGHTIPNLIEHLDKKEQIVLNHKYTYRAGDWSYVSNTATTIYPPFNKVYLFRPFLLIIFGKMTPKQYSIILGGNGFLGVVYR